jgi:hypothetical protein
MDMRRLGTWLGMAALALQLAWPLVAGALPRSVVLVPVCTVDGVTHYLEVPTGKDPRGGSAAHTGHCPLCCAGSMAPAGSLSGFSLPERAFAQPLAPEVNFVAKPFASPTRARAPPFSLVVPFTSIDHELGRTDEKALLAGRDADRAPDRDRFLRLGLLHRQH